MSNASSIAESLNVFKINHDGWYQCKCPIHEDNKPSMGVKDGNEGSVIFNCFAGCDSSDIASYFKDLGFDVHKIKEEKIEKKEKLINKNMPNLPKKEVARYQYISVDGELLFEKIRYEPKGFMIVNPLGNGQGGHSGALYGAQLLKDCETPIYIVEGEKDADFLTGLGLVAVTSGGASSWPEKNNYLFKDSIVRIIPDNDEPGAKYAEKVGASLKSVAKSVTIGKCPIDFSDVSDWNCAKQDIIDLFENHSFKTISFSDLLLLEMSTDWLIKDYIESHCFAQVFGASGSGKSFFALEMAYCVASGTQFFDKPVKKGNVLYIAGEGFNGLKKRALALQQKHGAEIGCLEFSKQAADFLDSGSCDDVHQRIINNEDGFDLIVVDTLSRNFGSGDENKTVDMAKFVTNVDRYLRSTGAAVIVVHHTGLENKDRGRGSGVLYNALDSEFLVQKDEQNNMEIKCTKNKEGESHWVKELTLNPVIIGHDAGGEDIYSCIVIEPDNVDVLNERDQSVYDGLKQACIEEGVEMTIDDTVVYPVQEKFWKNNCLKRLEGRKNIPRDYGSAKKILVDKGLVFVYENLFYVIS